MALPDIKINFGIPFQQEYFIKSGATTPIKDSYINPGEEPTDGLIKSHDSLEGTFYYEAENTSLQDDPLQKAKTFYPCRALKITRYYRQWVNYNLN